MTLTAKTETHLCLEWCGQRAMEIATAWSGWQWEASLLVWPWDAWGGLPAAGVLLALQHLILPGQFGQAGGGGEAAHLLLLPVAH